METALYNFALRWAWNPALAEELVQDAFIRIWRMRSEVESDTLRGLAYKMVQNLARNEQRRTRLKAMLPNLGWMEGSEVRSGEEEFIARESIEGLRAALEALPLELRETLLLCQFSEMSHEEIAAVLKISPGTVASRKNRALAILKEKWNLENLELD